MLFNFFKMKLGCLGDDFTDDESDISIPFIMKTNRGLLNQTTMWGVANVVEESHRLILLLEVFGYNYY
ncbi:hypothetical protein HanXRQr2_Chr14g0648371 [Helianthus annuus]|uniref:Uncharacterized protein n=2 Tax=Helianthus annuus TaxID=4232 RepID=A0A9K3EAT3_HELAN|nr:hypothetical protein HanXRQr2_Chr14g0648371 [Helianthus annuus]